MMRAYSLWQVTKHLLHFFACFKILLLCWRDSLNSKSNCMSLIIEEIKLVIYCWIINFNNTCFNCTHFDHSLWLKVDHSSRFLVRPTHDWNLREFPWIKHHMTWDPRNSHGELVRNTSLWKGSINLFSCILVIPKFPREPVTNSSSYLRHST